jgi:hypothetical protein
MINPCGLVRKTCQKVFDKSKLVKINHLMIEKFIADLSEKVKKEGIAYDKWSDWHIDDPKQYDVEKIVTYCFVVDAMNFCFWPDNPSGNFEYDSMTRNLEKVLKSDPEFFTCDRLIEVNSEWLRANVFTPNFCLVDERARIINEMAHVIKHRYNQSFY